MGPWIGLMTVSCCPSRPSTRRPDPADPPCPARPRIASHRGGGGFELKFRRARRRNKSCNASPRRLSISRSFTVLDIGWPSIRRVSITEFNGIAKRWSPTLHDQRLNDREGDRQGHRNRSCHDPATDETSTTPPREVTLERTMSMPTPRPLVSVTSSRVEIPGAKARLQCLPARSGASSDIDQPPCLSAIARSFSGCRCPCPSSVTAMTTWLPRWKAVDLDASLGVLASGSAFLGLARWRDRERCARCASAGRRAPQRSACLARYPLRGFRDARPCRVRGASLADHP